MVSERLFSLSQPLDGVCSFLYKDGGLEVISARFITPEAALAECNEGKITFMPPQFYIITTLASILRGAKNTAAQRATVQQLSQGAFGQMVINPRRLKEPDSEGRAILTYEGDETRGGSKGRLHRALVRLDKAGVSSSCTLSASGYIINVSRRRSLHMRSSCNGTLIYLQKSNLKRFTHQAYPSCKHHGVYIEDT